MDLLNLYVKILADDQVTKAIDKIGASAITKGQLISDGIKTALNAAYDTIKSVIGGAYNAYAQYEQLVGGAETLFQNASGQVVENAQNAFQTAGVSANQYLEMVNTFAASLVNSVARSHGAVQMTTEEIKSATETIRRSVQDANTAEQRRLSDLLDATRDSLQERYDARKEELDKELSDLQDQQSMEVEEFNRGTEERIRLMTEEYDEKVRLIDAELDARLAAIDAELEALDTQEDAQSEAEKRRERSRKEASLKEAIEYAGSVDERVAAEEAYREYIEKISSEDARDARKKRREELREQRKDIQDDADERKSELKSQYDEQVRQFSEQQAALLEEMRESHRTQLEETRENNARILEELQRSNSNQIEEMQRANEDALREFQRAQSDQQSVQIAALNQTDSYVEKTEKDYEEAAKLANRAVVDMADNANKMGTSMEMVQNSYRGLSMGNFTMLDNLKLGFSGTKTEMERLLDTAEQIQASNGNMVDYSIDSFADMVDAIHVVQQEYEISGYTVDEIEQKIKDQSLTEQDLMRVSQDLGITYEEAMQKMKDGSLTAKEAIILTGTTSYEAASTIEGSTNQMKAAWENWLVALANPDMNFGEATDNLVNSITVAASNIVPRVGEILTSIVQSVPSFIGEIGTMVADTISSTDWQEVGQTVIDGLLGALASFVEFRYDLLQQLTEFLPEFITAAGEFIGGVVGGLIENWPKVIETLYEGIGSLLATLVEKAPEILAAAVTFFGNIVQGIVESTPKALENIGHLIGVVIEGIVGSVGRMLEAGGQFIGGLIKGIQNGDIDVVGFFAGLPGRILEALGAIGTFLLESGKSLLTGFLDGVSGKNPDLADFFAELPQNLLNAMGAIGSFLLDAGQDLLNGLFDGIKDIGESVVDWFENLPTNILNAIGSLGDLLFSAGQDILNGLWDGLTDVWDGLTDWVTDIGDWIAEHKGPKEYDLKLLVPNGQWIMQSLEAGMRSAFPLIERTVDDITDMLSIDQHLTFAGVSGMQTQSARTLPPVSIYMTYNAGEDGTKIVDDMVSQLSLYGYTMGGRQYASNHRVLRGNAADGN